MKIKTSVIDVVLECLTLLILAGSTLYLLVNWPSMPEQIPAHYNFAGEIDRWGGKGEVVVLVVIMWLLCVGITVLERVPGIWNTGVKVTPANIYHVYRTLKYMIKTMKFLIVLIFGFLIVNSVLGKPLPGWFTPVYLVLIFGDLAVWLIRLYWGRR